MTNIILCGGSGTRLWPLSRKLMPKQFLKLFSDKSLFQLTIERNKKVTTSQIVVSNEEQYFIALDQVEEIEESAKFLLESVAKIIFCSGVKSRSSGGKIDFRLLI